MPKENDWILLIQPYLDGIYCILALWNWAAFTAVRLPMVLEVTSEVLRSSNSWICASAYKHCWNTEKYYRHAVLPLPLSSEIGEICYRQKHWSENPSRLPRTLYEIPEHRQSHSWILWCNSQKLHGAHRNAFRLLKRYPYRLWRRSILPGIKISDHLLQKNNIYQMMKEGFSRTR